MKKFIVILLTVLLISSFVTPAFAAQITEHVFNQDVTCYVAASGGLTAKVLFCRPGFRSTPVLRSRCHSTMP